MTKNRRGGRRKMVCYSPQSILCRWISSFKRSRDYSISRRSSEMLSSEEKRESASRRLEKMNDGESVKESLLLGSRATGDDDENSGSKGKSSSMISEEWISPTEMVPSSGRYMKDVSISLGLGFSLAYLMAASKREFNKVVELQTQVETLIKEFKDKNQRNDVISEPSLLNNCHGLSTTNPPVVGNAILNPTIQNCVSSHHLVETEIKVKSDWHSKSSTPKREECALGIDQLEEELQTELERLQLSLDNENLPKHQHCFEMIVENTTAVRSHVPSFGEVDDPEEANTREHGGVSPNELARRLHELLEAQQQQRITELESALECAKHKLRQKEIEVSLWKDSAKLVSQRVIEAKCFSRCCSSRFATSSSHGHATSDPHLH